ncbi:MAG: hypothetical protein ACR2MY_10915 [Candidatus Dormibacteria bacterium]
MARQTKPISFSIYPEEEAVVDRLAARYGGGERTKLFRFALEQLKALERWERLVSIQAYGVELAGQTGMGATDAVEITHVRRRERGSARLPIGTPSAGGILKSIPRR